MNRVNAKVSGNAKEGPIVTTFEIPLVGIDGIPLRDEIELELFLQR